MSVAQIAVECFIVQPILFVISLVDKVLGAFQPALTRNHDIKDQKSPYTYSVDETDSNADYRSVFLKNNEHLNPDYKNLYEEFKKSSQQYSNKNILGAREKLSSENEKLPDGKLLKKLSLAKNFEWTKFSKALETVDSLSNGFLNLGLKSNDNLVLFMETRQEWLISSIACFRINVPIVTLYATLGIDALAYGIIQTNTKFLITSGDQLSKLEQVLDKIPSVSHIIVVTDKVNSDYLETFRLSAKKHGKTTVEYSEIINSDLSKENNNFKAPTKNDLAIIMYTSGSTGNPKGVMISHNNLYTTAKSLLSRVPKLVPGEDIYIGYLPLAHVLELMSELAYVIEGIAIGYSSPQTLTDASTSIKKGDTGDLRVLNPTIMHAVPAVLERLKKAVTMKLAHGSPLKQSLFTNAFKQKLNCIRSNTSTPLLDKILFNKVSTAVVGNKLRYIITGGALLNHEVHEFVQVCFCPVQQAYGLTETTGGGTTQIVGESMTNTSGSVLPTLAIRLVDWIEGNYRNTDTPYPRGEVYIGGDNVTLGYYNNKELTDQDYKVFNGVRYFATGDIGEMIDGNLKIIDRKKDLVKLSGGEFVSLNKVESILKLQPFVDSCCVLANGAKANCVCIISAVPKELIAILEKEPSLMTELNRIELIKDDKLKSVELVQLLEKNPQIIEKITKESIAFCLNKKLFKFEIPVKYMFVPEAWLPDTGLVTDSLKIKRKSVEMYYKDKIEKFYT